MSKALTFADFHNIKTREDMYETGKAAAKQKDAGKVHNRRLEVYPDSFVTRRRAEEAIFNSSRHPE